DAVLAAPRPQLALDAPAHEIVEDLVGGGGRAAGQRPQLLHVGGIEIADAVVADLAGLLEGNEALDPFRPPRATPPVRQIEMDGVGAERLEAALAGGGDAAARGVVRIDFADDEGLVAAAGEGLADQLLDGALAVHLGRIDERQPEIEAEPQRRDLLA